MNIALMSDLHLLSKTPENRCDDILEDQWGKLEFVLKHCKKNGIQHLFQAGDFFDIPRNWETLHRTINLLQKYPSVKIYCVEGQHDKYMRNDEVITNLSLLHRLGFITILKNSIEFNGIKVHGISFEDGMDIDKAIDAVMEEQYDPDLQNILVIHAPISDAPLFPGHEFSKAKNLLKKHKDLDLILCGDIHKQFMIILPNSERMIVNTGSMVRKERNLYNESHIPSFYTYMTSTQILTYWKIPCKPFNKAFSKVEKIIESDLLGEFVDAIQHPIADEMDIYKKIERFITENNIDKLVSQWITEVQSNERNKNSAS